MPDKQKQHTVHFLDSLKAIMHLRNDAALSRKLGVAPPVISKIRHEKLPVTTALLFKVHDASGLSIPEMRSLLYKTGTLVDTGSK